MKALFQEEQTEDMGEITKEAQDFLPEFALIDYLLQSQQLLDISSYIGQYKYLSALAPFRGKFLLLKNLF